MKGLSGLCTECTRQLLPWGTCFWCYPIPEPGEVRVHPAFAAYLRHQAKWREIEREDNLRDRQREKGD